jgi:hypothetical protein
LYKIFLHVWNHHKKVIFVLSNVTYCKKLFFVIRQNTPRKGKMAQKKQNASSKMFLDIMCPSKIHEADTKIRLKTLCTVKNVRRTSKTVTNYEKLGSFLRTFNWALSSLFSVAKFFSLGIVSCCVCPAGQLLRKNPGAGWCMGSR